MIKNRYASLCGRPVRFYGKGSVDFNDIKHEDEPTKEARVEPNSFGLYLARRRKSKTQRAQEIQELKDMVRELKETHKEDVKTQQRLMKAIDEMTRRQVDTDAENKDLRQEIENLLSRISVGNKIRFGSISQNGTKKKAAPVQDCEKDSLV